jgi:FAD/FMN-containing dehydrogenase/Fe-S oxidoreductase
MPFPTETASALENDLRCRIEGEVRFDRGSRALYATDASNYRQVPIGVVMPCSKEDVVATMDACRRHGAPVLSRGGGTSLAGQCCNVAVVIDHSKYLRRVVAIDPERRTAVVEPGCVLDHLRAEAEKHHLTFGPDPATHDHNTLGGMLGNNSCGVHSIMAGRTVDNTRRLEVLTYDGLRMWVGPTSDDDYGAILAAGDRRAGIYRRLHDLAQRYAEDIRARYPKIPRRVSGYNLDALLPENGFNVARALVGSEGTLVAILEAELRLIPSPPCRVLLILGYPSVFEAADHVVEVRTTGVIGLEGIDDKLIHYMQVKNLHADDARALPEGGGWLVAEYGADSPEQAEAVACAAMERLGRVANPPSMKLYTDKAEQARIWEIRESGLGATANVPGQPLTWPGWEDAAVAPANAGKYLREFRALLTRFGYDCSLYGHFGDGCIHCRIDFDMQTRNGINKYLAFTDAAADLVIKHGGSLSGEHGDGQARGPLLEKMFGPRLMEAMREFKSIWDPQWAMNPGKVILPFARDDNLRLGMDFHPDDRPTRLAFPEDGGDFNRTTMRCVGVGACRRTGGNGVMCPSFMATHEEKHSTRGRARLLFEMVHGGAIGTGWKQPAVWEALDLCLCCKGCKGDCPVNVDMASYKAEFASHWFEGKVRPREAYALGLIPWWARAASMAPGVANALMSAAEPLVKKAGNIARERRLPRFAPRTFSAGFRPGGEGTRVLLFPDTFTEHFHPHVGDAAVAVLRRAGCQVAIPEKRLCCGRPLFAWGWLDRARGWLGEVLATLEPDIRAGTPVVMLEPACASTFKDELQRLFPGDARAQALGRQTFMLADFLGSREGWTPPRLSGRALLHPHCYERAHLGTGHLETILGQMGLATEQPRTGCCGMAGSFGFEAPHYAVAQACGERVLLPAVRAAGQGTFLVADGFSCREMIGQSTGRHAMHLAEVLALAEGP